MSKDLSRLIQQQSSKKKNTIDRERERMDILRAVKKTSAETGGARGDRAAIFSISGVVVTEVGKLKIYNHTGASLTITAIHGTVSSTPVTTDIQVDINKNGASILASPLVIAAGSLDGVITGIASPSWANGEYLTMDVDQSSAAGGGENLVVQVVCS